MSTQNITLEMIEEFLFHVDSLFPTPLSHKQNLYFLAEKLYNHATICAKIENGKIVSAVFGYTKNLEGNRGYISVVATLPCAQSRGLASALIQDFIRQCETAKISAVHLYAVSDNVAAIRMYEKLGFEPYILENEPRPEDAHLIYYI